MAFPQTLDTFVRRTPGQTIVTTDVNDLQQAIERMQTKIGVDGSTVVTSLDNRISQLAFQIDPTDQVLTLS